MPRILRSSSSASVYILRLDMVLCRLVSIGSAAVDMRRGSRAVAIESALLTGEGAILTCHAVAFGHCSSTHRGFPVAGHNNPSPMRAALRCDHTSLAHARGAVA
jgi:hypothetical protein